MIKESALDKCFRSRPSRDDHRISPLPPRYECPRPSLSIITSAPETGRTGRRSCSIIPCAIIRALLARLEHSNFFKVKGRPPGPLNEERPRERADARRGGTAPPTGTYDRSRAPAVRHRPPRDPTTSFLTAAALIYAIGAGITAAAGTRLALQWVVAVRGLDCAHSDRGARLETRIVISRHYLPELGVGKLRACCLPWMW